MLLLDEKKSTKNLKFPVFPCKQDKTPHLKWKEAATTDVNQINKWLQQWSDCMFGIPTGLPETFFVLDVDTGSTKNGLESLKQLQEEFEPLPDTVVVQTPSGGFHYYFTTPENVDDYKNSVSKIGQNLDIRIKAGYVIAAGSKNDKGVYAYIEGKDPESIKISEAPKWLLNMMLKPVEKSQAIATKDNSFVDSTNNKVGDNTDLAGKKGEGRNSYLTSIAGTLRKRGMKFIDIFSALLGRNCTFEVPLPESEVEEIARSISKYTAGLSFNPSEEVKRILSHSNFTDVQNARRLIAFSGNTILYCSTLKAWFVWSGSTWVHNLGGDLLMRLSIIMLDQLSKYAPDADPNIASRQLKNDFFNNINNLKNLRPIKNMIKIAESLKSIEYSSFDSNPMLFNLKNGTYNLHTGKLLPHRSSDRITKMSEIDFKKDATCPNWLNFLSEVMCNDSQLIEYLQKAVGYSLTGSTKEQVFFLLHGTGANGKSVFTNILNELLGNYVKRTPFVTFLKISNESIRNDLASLALARLVLASESERGAEFSEALLKQITGGDSISARFLNKEFFEYKPQFKVWLSTNHFPKTLHSRENFAFWRRVKVLPFEVEFAPEKQNKNLFEELKKEMPGILNWALAGVQKWQNEGLDEPMAVKTAIKQYKTASNPLDNFFNESSTFGKTKWTSSDDIKKAYRSWCKRLGEYQVSDKNLWSYLREKGCNGIKKDNKRGWAGIKINSLK